MTTGELPRILRRPGQPEHPTFLELFFDLIYVFMLSRISQELFDDPSLYGAAQAGVLLAAAWWVWVLTAWLTDLFDPRLPLIQALVLTIMFGTLVMALAIPRAFETHAAAFVAAYFGIHLARDGVLIPGTRVNRSIQARSIRVFFWLLVTAGLWVGGVFTDATTRLVLWAIAVAVDFGAARLGWPTPGLGRTELASKIFSGLHLIERHRQILIVALGELVLSAGLGLIFSEFHAARAITSGVEFASAVLLFQLYFHRVRRVLKRENLSVIERVRPGTATSYTHVVMTAGVVVTSAGASLVIRDPTREAPLAWAVVVLGGPALFLLGTFLFDYMLTNRILWSRVVAILALAATTAATPLLPPLGIMIAASLLLLITLVAEQALGARQPATLAPPR